MDDTCHGAPILIALIMAAALTACPPTRYRVVLQYPDAAALMRAATVEVWVGAGLSCDQMQRGAGDRQLLFEAHAESPDLGAVHAGANAFYAVVRDASCARFLAGCALAEVEPGRELTVRIGLASSDSAGCPTGERCVNARCLAGDASVGQDRPVSDRIATDATGDSGEPDSGPGDRTVADRGPSDSPGADRGTDAGSRADARTDVGPTGDAAPPPDAHGADGGSGWFDPTRRYRWAATIDCSLPALPVVIELPLGVLASTADTASAIVVDDLLDAVVPSAVLPRTDSVLAIAFFAETSGQRPVHVYIGDIGAGPFAQESYRESTAVSGTVRVGSNELYEVGVPSRYNEAFGGVGFGGLRMTNLSSAEPSRVKRGVRLYAAGTIDVGTAFTSTTIAATRLDATLMPRRLIQGVAGTVIEQAGGASAIEVHDFVIVPGMPTAVAAYTTIRNTSASALDLAVLEVIDADLEGRFGDSGLVSGGAAVTWERDGTPTQAFGTRTPWATSLGVGDYDPLFSSIYVDGNASGASTIEGVDVVSVASRSFILAPGAEVAVLSWYAVGISAAAVASALSTAVPTVTTAPNAEFLN